MKRQNSLILSPLRRIIKTLIDPSMCLAWIRSGMRIQKGRPVIFYNNLPKDYYEKLEKSKTRIDFSIAVKVP